MKIENINLNQFLKERLISSLMIAMLIAIILPIVIKLEGQLLSSSLIALLCGYEAISQLPQKYMTKLPIKIAIYIPLISLMYIIIIPLIYYNIKFFIMIDIIISNILNICYYNRSQIFNEILKNHYNNQFNLQEFSNNQVTYMAVGSILGYIINLIIIPYFELKYVLVIVMILLNIVEIFWLMYFNKIIIKI